ncbi:hypothetical protein Anapl_01071 [Anas platyrhynchos]|uniref:Uncharacterized protein n=1 Tax=Anas platyrhynchos TaxID=8839 RepID=R0LM21_ANAPL|nr:hypothetical protein Anapl_01071 [Anas platyrhynchos]
MHEGLMAASGKLTQDQMDCCKSGLEDQASKQGGLWITLSLTEDQDSNISTRPVEPIPHSRSRCRQGADRLIFEAPRGTGPLDHKSQTRLHTAASLPLFCCFVPALFRRAADP